MKRIRVFMYCIVQVYCLSLFAADPDADDHRTVLKEDGKSHSQVAFPLIAAKKISDAIGEKESPILKKRIPKGGENTSTDKRRRSTDGVPFLGEVGHSCTHLCEKFNNGERLHSPRLNTVDSAPIPSRKGNWGDITPTTNPQKSDEKKKTKQGVPQN